MSSEWQCSLHGGVQPFKVTRTLNTDALEQLAAASRVPVWLPNPMPPGWSLTGLAQAGDDRGASASVVAASGPSPVGGPADLILVAEEPRVGLGARYAGLDVEPEIDTASPPDGKVEAAGHPTTMWRVASSHDRTAFVGEARGVWLWLVVWPAMAELVLLEHLRLHDVHDGVPADVTIGAASPYLDLAAHQD